MTALFLSVNFLDDSISINSTTEATQISQAQLLIFVLLSLVFLFVFFMLLTPWKLSKFIWTVLAAIAISAIGLVVGAALLWQPQVIQTAIWVGGAIAALVVVGGVFVLISRVWANHSYGIVRTVVESNERMSREVRASHERIERGYQNIIAQTIGEIFADRYDERRVIARIGQKNYQALLESFESGAVVSGQYLLMPDTAVEGEYREVPLSELSFDEQMVARKLDTIAREAE